jgi:dipeptidyl aminopeptidase/acylaminoacyl peptidase
MRRLAVFAFALGCSSSPSASEPTDAATTTPDVALDTEVDAGPPAFTSVEVTKTTDKTIIEKVKYKSGSLTVVGQVCRPKEPGKRKVLIWAHGGFSGLGMNEWNGGLCEGGANNGWVVIEPSYRGEDGSEGTVEVCLGEVDDTLEMTRIALAQPWADPTKVALLGGSHGGCVALRAVQRGIPVQVAGDVFGVTDWAADWAYWTNARKTATTAQQGVYDALFKQLRDSTGGSPEEKPAEYAKRSPITFGADLEKFKGDLMMIHGVLDELVIVSDTCRLASTLSTTTALHLDAMGNVLTTKPSGCPESAFAWSSPPKPTTWPAKRYVVIRDGVGHGAWVPATGLMEDALWFIAAKLP